MVTALKLHDLVQATDPQLAETIRLNLNSEPYDTASGLAWFDVWAWIKAKKQQGYQDIYSEFFELKSPLSRHEHRYRFLQDLKNDGYVLKNLTSYTNYFVFEILTSQGSAIIRYSYSYDTMYVHSTDEQFGDILKQKYGKLTESFYVSWAYVLKGEVKYKYIDYSFDDKLFDEFYPFLPEPSEKFRDKGRVKGYFAEYMASPAPVMLLIGEPGTGKTTFIRHLIQDQNLKNTVIAYDEHTLSHDSFYYDFVGGNTPLMVIEDADLLLAAREDSINKNMNKLLNVSDGIVKLNKKKIIFSTNLDSVSKIDEALIRPGRCFSVLSFRHLTMDEARAAAKVAGLPSPEGEAQMPLTKIFNPSRSQGQEPRRGRIGF